VGILEPRPLLCDRTRSWVSLSLDGELSEFERALVSAHLERCAQCAAFAAEATAATTLLRDAPLERVPMLVTLPARRRGVGSLALRVGAAAALLIGTLGLVGSITTDSESTLNRAGIVRGASDDTNDRLIRHVKRQALMPAAQSYPHPVLMPL
jgi:anti-sigma factor RsiW